MANGYLTGCALIISSLITFILFLKKSIANVETKIFRRLLIFNILESLTTTSIVVVALTNNSYLLYELLNRIDVNFIIWWCSFLFYYICSVCKIEKIKVVRILIFVINLVVFVLSLFLPVHIIATNGILDSSGLLTVMGLYGAVIYIIAMILVVFSAIDKKTNQIKLIPFYFLIIMLLIIVYLRIVIPHINFISIMITLVDLIMIFTIENPDLKLLNEYIKNKEIAEKNIEEKANTLFKISQEVKTPIAKIEMLSSKIMKSKEIDVMYNDAKNINNISKHVYGIINNVLDISQIDKQNLKIFDATFNIYNLFNQIVILANGKYNEDIIFKYNIEDKIPENLYGDSSKLKQVICSVLFNAFENTKRGTIDLDISSIIKYDVCRLIIAISDTGKGISLNQINEILESNSDINIEDLEKIEKLDVDLKITKKIVDILGGTLLIKSCINEGTTITIILDQKILESKETSTLENTVKMLSNKRRVLLVNDDYKELEKILLELKKNNLSVISTMSAKDCINLTKSQFFDLILIDDEMDSSNAVELINELKSTNVKVVIMLDKNKTLIKKHYLKDYPFDDYLLKDIYKDEIKRIISKYLK